MEVWREELYHYGVKGQEWGVQNGPPYPLSDRTRKQMVRAQRRRDYANRELMSDEELRNRINRLQMERQYRELNNEMVESGKSTLQRSLKTAGEKTLTNAMQGAMAWAVAKGVGALTGNDDFGTTIAKGSYKEPKNKKAEDN